MRVHIEWECLGWMTISDGVVIEAKQIWARSLQALVHQRADRRLIFAPMLSWDGWCSGDRFALARSRPGPITKGLGWRLSWMRAGPGECPWRAAVSAQGCLQALSWRNVGSAGQKRLPLRFKLGSTTGQGAIGFPCCQGSLAARDRRRWQARPAQHDPGPTKSALLSDAARGPRCGEQTQDGGGQSGGLRHQGWLELGRQQIGIAGPLGSGGPILLAEQASCGRRQGQRRSDPESRPIAGWCRSAGGSHAH